MLLSDLALGLVLHGTAIFLLMPYVYACFVATVCLGLWVRTRHSPMRIAAAALASSTLFYLVTNFGSWLAFPIYPQTWDGLVACYVAGLPFFRNALVGDAVCTALLFGGFALAARYCATAQAMDKDERNGRSSAAPLEGRRTLCADRRRCSKEQQTQNSKHKDFHCPFTARTAAAFRTRESAP